MRTRGALSAWSLATVLSAQQFDVEMVALPSGGGFHLAVADTNGDGLPDGVVTRWGGVTILRNDGVGGFESMFLSITNILYEPQLLDVDLDGRLDIWAGGAFGPLALRGQSDGGWAPGIPPGAINGKVLFVDLDADGDPDFVGTNVGAELAVALNDGAGGFGPLNTVAAHSHWSTFGTLAAGDLDGDGHVDIVSLSYGVLRILLGDGAGGLVEQPVINLPASYSLALADVDDDGDLDLVAGTQILQNNGAGQFLLSNVLPMPSVHRALATDIDGDGKVDLAFGCESSVRIFRGLGGGNFASVADLPTGPTYGLAVSDLDVDGDQDFVTLTQQGNQLVILRNVTPLPPGMPILGSGTPACAGNIGIRSTHSPVLGETAFRVVCANAPSRSSGILLLGGCAFTWDPLGFGLSLNVDSAFVAGTLTSDVQGSASHGLPIPDDDSLLGLQVCLQSVWLSDPGRGDTCSPALFDLASSGALVLFF